VIFAIAFFHFTNILIRGLGLNGKNLDCVIRRGNLFQRVARSVVQNYLAQFRRHGCTSSAKSHFRFRNV